MQKVGKVKVFLQKQMKNTMGKLGNSFFVHLWRSAHRSSSLDTNIFTLGTDINGLIQ
jgi:hypothetical protein